MSGGITKAAISKLKGEMVSPMYLCERSGSLQWNPCGRNRGTYSQTDTMITAVTKNTYLRENKYCS